jgi:hypothetical protein
MPKHDDDYCGAPATKLVLRGQKRLYTCGSCPYEGGGRVVPYETETPDYQKKAGVFSGPARKCGERVE